VEDCIGLPSLPDLLNELDRDVDIESLEQLTQSLLQDIAADLEAAAQKTNCQEPDVGGQNRARPVVGSPSEDLESSRCDSVKSENGLEDEISPFLLLHHDYSAKPESQAQTLKINSKITPKNRNKALSVSRDARRNLKKPSTHKHLNTKTKLKPIMPKTAQKECNLETLYVNTVPDISMDSSDVLYGTLDESTNCITIIVNDENLSLSEAVTEVTTTDEVVEVDDTLSDPTVLLTESSNVQTLQLPSISENLEGLSPAYSSSDCGYESFDSPLSVVNDTDLDMWDQSVSELFPMLC